MLAEEAPRVLRVSWCVVVHSAGTGVERIAASHGAPETQAESAPWLPLAQAVAPDGSGAWVPHVWRAGGHCWAARACRASGRRRWRGLGYLAGIVATILR
ncbi:amino acid-binding protein [Mycolicibacterium conceptionense]|uniref:Amino acid-binding protein n=1 Tax=Mycolicibacterium conceptionense TaxID=451644 RepID=A0A0U1DCS9_9MYCO|nr:amino acid-binding protein [Mycolicibacterium conceptionense]